MTSAGEGSSVGVCRSQAKNGGTIAISQPMFFPWVGMLEQLRLADTFVYYDDVQFAKGSFSNRVQIKTHTGIEWLTLPLQGRKLGQRIIDVRLDESRGFRRRHMATLQQAYATAPFRDEMLACAARVYALPSDWLVDLAMESMTALCEAFGIGPAQSVRSSELNIGGASSARVLEVVKRFEGSRYVTGHGAQHYLDHEAFERSRIEVNYMDYRQEPYPQRFGDFTPFVSGLDLLANLGSRGSSKINSDAIPWRDFITPPAKGRATGCGNRLEPNFGSANEAVHV